MSNFCNRCGKRITQLGKLDATDDRCRCPRPSIKLQDVKHFSIPDPLTFPKVEAMWQCCPICSGKGAIPSDLMTNFMTETCSICKGEKIIHIQSGLPPSLHNKK